MTFEVLFIGRQKGALGLRRQIRDSVEAETKDEALIALYDTWEHISAPMFWVKTGDGFKFRVLEDGSLSDGDLVYENLDALKKELQA